MLLLDFENQGIRSAVWHVTETVEQLVSIHPNGIHLYEQSKSKFKSNSRIKEWLAVRVLLNHMLGSNAEIVYTENGAPRLKGSNTHISISHTKEYACIALSDIYKVGVDIEHISNKAERVKSRFIGENEPDDTLLKTILIWSAKESAYKMLQIEGIDFKKDMKVYPFHQAECGCLAIMCMNNIYDVLYSIKNDFVMTLIYSK